jgi:UDP-N-acetylmuramoylalanine--D-glutamate ligase
MTESYTSFFKDKNITVMGLGLLGRGVGDVRFLAECGARLTVTDMKDAQTLQPSLDRLKDFPDIAFVLGGHREEDFTSADMVLKAAGVPLDSPHIKAAEEAGVPVYMSTALFAKLSGSPSLEGGGRGRVYDAEQNLDIEPPHPHPPPEGGGVVIVGVTGTRGKSTVTQLIYEGLKASGARAHLGGNVRGMSTLALLPEVRPGDTAVLELDSWQLQGFRDLKISPHIAVFTNFMPDHMNYYHDDLDRYFYDKAGIFAHQDANDVLITGQGVADKIKSCDPNAKWMTPPPLPEDWHLQLPGAHNRANAALAREALSALKIDDDIIRCAFKTYTGLDGRLNFLAGINGIKIYNDSNATTPEATIAALQAFDAGKILLIAGGTDKNLALDGLANQIRESCKAAVFLKGNGTDRLKDYCPGIPVFDDLDKAFDTLIKQGQAGDVLLFSPAFTSFGMYQNEYERSDQFKKIVMDCT